MEQEKKTYDCVITSEIGAYFERFTQKNIND